MRGCEMNSDHTVAACSEVYNERIIATTRIITSRNPSTRPLRLNVQGQHLRFSDRTCPLWVSIVLEPRRVPA